MVPPVHAQTSAPCDGADLGAQRACSDQRAAQIAGGPAWMACAGSCAIRQDGADAVVLDLKGKERKRLPGLRFLPGAGQTQCLSLLPFLTEAGHLQLLDSDSFVAAEDFPLTDLYDGNPVKDPSLLPNVLELAQLSCDGTRFFAPQQDGPGFVRVMIGQDGLAVPDDNRNVIVVSPTGRYGVTLDSGEGEALRLQDYILLTDLEINARFEVDTVFFDIEEKNLLIRHSDGQSMEVEIVSLDDGTVRGTVPYPAEAGLSFRVTDQGGKPALEPVNLPN
ncbi:hypothetical protein [Paracoccus aminophilus]|nr:hypothetical protein [Paracoccus aminophilus]